MRAQSRSIGAPWYILQFFAHIVNSADATRVESSIVVVAEPPPMWSSKDHLNPRPRNQEGRKKA